MAAIPTGVGKQPDDRRPSTDPVGQLLRVSEAIVATARRVVDVGLSRLQLRLHAWQVDRDPDARSWVEDALRKVKDGTATADASSREDILKAIESRQASR